MLKDLFETLFRTMCPLVFTGSTYTDYEVPDSRQIIAPYDGWAMYLAENVNDVYSLSIQSDHIVNTSPSYDTKWGAVYVPCRKGQTITATVNGEGKPTLRIIPTALPE